MNKKLLKRILSLLMALIMFINISCFYSLKPKEVKAMGGTVVVTGSAITLATALKVVCGAVAVCGALVGAEALVNNADDIKNGINKLQNDIKDSSTEIYQNVKASYTETAEKIKNNISYISAKYGANATNDLLDDSSWWEIPGDVELGDDLIINIPWGETETEDVIQSWEKNLPDEYFQDPEAYAKKFFEQYNQESEENKDKLGGGGNNGNNFKNSKFWKKIKGYLTLASLVGGSSATIGSMLGHYFADYEQLESEKSALSNAEYNSRYNSLVDSISNDDSLIKVVENVQDRSGYNITDSKYDGFCSTCTRECEAQILIKTKGESGFSKISNVNLKAYNGYFSQLNEDSQSDFIFYFIFEDIENAHFTFTYNDTNYDIYIKDYKNSNQAVYNNLRLYPHILGESTNIFDRTLYIYGLNSRMPLNINDADVYPNCDQYYIRRVQKPTWTSNENVYKDIGKCTYIPNYKINNKNVTPNVLAYVALFGDSCKYVPDGNLVLKGYANTLTKKDNTKSIPKEVDNNIPTNFKITDTLSTVTPEQTRDIAVTDKLIETALRVQQNFPEDTKPTPEQLNQIAFEEVQKTFDDIINDVKDPITTPDYEDIIDGTFTPETTDPTLPTNPSTPDVPDVPEDINFNGINGIDLKKFFPFCIPFDLYNFLVWLNKEPQCPIIELPIVIDMLHINTVLTLDLSDYEALSNILRTFLAVIYTVALMLKTRDIIRG